MIFETDCGFYGMHNQTKCTSCFVVCGERWRERENELLQVKRI